MVVTKTHTDKTNKVGFSDFADKLEEVKSSTAEVIQQLPIDNDKATILISVEKNIKQVLFNLAAKNEKWLNMSDKTPLEWGADISISPEDLKHLPNSITGVIIHYIVKGIKEDFGIGFEKLPKCLTYNLSKLDKKVAGKKKLLSRAAKNKLLAQTQMSYYDEKIISGEMTIESAMFKIKEKYEEIQGYRDLGYILPPEKTKYPYYLDEAKNSDDKAINDVDGILE